MIKMPNRILLEAEAALATVALRAIDDKEKLRDADVKAAVCVAIWREQHRVMSILAKAASHYRVKLNGEQFAAVCDALAEEIGWGSELPEGTEDLVRNDGVYYVSDGGTKMLTASAKLDHTKW